MMLGCTETVTLVRCRHSENGDSFSREVIHGVSWYAKSGSAISAANGETPGTEITVRIPAAVCPSELPVAGDYLVKGLLPSRLMILTPGVLQSYDSFRIAKVGDNRRVCLPHVVVKSA